MAATHSSSSAAAVPELPTPRRWDVPDPEKASIATYITLADNIKAANDEIIKFIKEQKDVVKSRNRFIRPVVAGDALAFVAYEDVVMWPAKDIISEWRVESSFNSIKDVFKDNLLWGIKTFEDLDLMNVKMVAAMDNYRLFGDSAVEAKRTLAAFVENYARMHQELEKLRALLKGPGSSLPDFQKATKEFEAATKKLLTTYGVHVAFPTVPSDVHLAAIGVTAEQEAFLRESITTVTGRSPPDAITLLYKASKDGFSAAEFHKRCDGQQGLLVIVKEAASGHLFGGYTGVGFKAGASSQYRDESAFVFTLSNPHHTAPTKFHPTLRPAEAIKSDPAFGPVFGSDLIIKDKSNNDGNGSSFAFPQAYADTTGKGQVLFTGSKDGWKAADILAFAIDAPSAGAGAAASKKK